MSFYCRAVSLIYLFFTIYNAQTLIIRNHKFNAFCILDSKLRYKVHL